MINDISKLERDLIKINNLSNFIHDIPKLHPDSPKYQKFWTDAMQKCIEGYWSYDETGYRFMPPSLYFYGNFFKITVTDKGKKTRLSARPTIRDIDWHIHYTYLEAQGFSGFSRDDDITCDKIILNPKELKYLELSEDRGQRERYANLLNSKGVLKKYIAAKDYLRQLHKTEKGIPLYYNDAKNVMIFGSRGKHRCPFN
jgi:hypothetical protein